MDTTTYEYVHPKTGTRAYVSHDVYENDPTNPEFIAHVPGLRATKHGSFEKAQKRLHMHGYDKHETPVKETGDVPVNRTYRATMESFDQSINESKVSHRNYSWGKLTTIGDAGSTVVLHPEHQDMVKNLSDGSSTQFKDEQNIRWNVKRSGDDLEFSAQAGHGGKHTVSRDKILNESSQEWKIIPHMDAKDPKSGHPMYGEILHAATGTRVQYHIDDKGRARSGMMRSPTLEGLMAMHSARLQKNESLYESTVEDKISYHKNMAAEKMKEYNQLIKKGSETGLKGHYQKSANAAYDVAQQHKVKLKYFQQQKRLGNYRIDESAAPGMEDWIKANKAGFIDQYGEKKGLQVLYATAWKLHDKKLNESDDLWSKINSKNYDAALKHADLSDDSDAQIELTNRAFKDSKLAHAIIGSDSIPEGTKARLIHHDDPKVRLAQLNHARKHDYVNLLEETQVKLVESSDAFDESEQHRELAEKAKAAGNMGAYHAHMANAHDSRAQWHESKGRANLADAAAEKAAFHHAESLKHDYVMENTDGTHEPLSEMVMDVIHHPVLGKVEWRNEAGKHMITMDNAKSRDDGVVNIHTMGPHKEFAAGKHAEIAKKWEFLKQRLIKEDGQWVALGGLNTLIESIFSELEGK